MVDRRYIELVNKWLDGELADEERADLDRYLAESRDALELQDDLTALEEMLGKLDRVDPPRELKGRILSLIDQAKYVPASSRAKKSRIWRLQPNLKYAYSFAAGLIIGVAVYALTTGTFTPGNDADLSRLTGTIIAGEKIDDVRPGGRREFAGSGFQGMLRAEFGKTLILVSVAIETDREVELVMGFDPEAVSFHGYQQSEAQDGDLHTASGALRLAHMGENEYTFIFHRRPGHATDLTFAIHAGGVLYEDHLKFTEGASE